MGIYSEYLEKNFSFQDLQSERKKLLKKISKLRGNRDILVYASDLTNKSPVSTLIDYSDILPFKDQLNNLKGEAIDIILETPGGIAEVVEDIVKLIRFKYKHVGIIVPGSAKSAGTILSMAGDEILMGTSSSLGPIDAQIVSANKRFSAEGYLTGLKKIKEEVEQTKKLNPAYIPILQNISPGEIQHMENAQRFSEVLVTQWLSKYKFQDWTHHSSNGNPVTQEEKEVRAKEIASELCNHSKWLTHGRSIKIEDFQKMRLKITDYSTDFELNDAITRYYTLLRMTFESSNMYKLFETVDTQISRFTSSNSPTPLPVKNDEIESAIVMYKCAKCQKDTKIQANFKVGAKLEKGAIIFPKNNSFVCPHCRSMNNLYKVRVQLEAQAKKKIV